jgi:hypothetical protein
MAAMNDEQEIRTETGIGYTDGSIGVWPTHEPELAPYFGADAIAHHLRQHGRVYRRRVIVVEQWTPIEYTGQRCATPDCLTCSRDPYPPTDQQA